MLEPWNFARYLIYIGKREKKKRITNGHQWRTKPATETVVSHVGSGRVVRSRECLLLANAKQKREMTLFASIRLKRVDLDPFAGFRHFIIRT